MGVAETDSMARICLYLEAAEAIERSGFRKAFDRQVRALGLNGIEVTTDPSDRPYDLLHLHAFGPKSLYWLKGAQRHGIPVVVHAHSVGAYDFRDSFTLSNALAPLYERYVRFVYNRADAVFTPTLFAKRELERVGVRRPIAIVSNGVDRERFMATDAERDRQRRNWGGDAFTAFCAGNVIPRKGVRDFLATAEQLPEVAFRWFGHRWSRAAAYWPDMETWLDRVPGNVEFPGYVRDTPGAFAAADVCFFPSKSETQGLVLLEAASLGKPLVVRDLEVYRDWLVHGENCLKGRNPAEFAGHIDALARDADLYERLAQAAESLAEAHRIEHVGAHLCRLYDEISTSEAREAVP